ncbi:MAG: YifB family Mg chelatase-like AAA ATPase [bacterium]|nr:YifB family Mg chelatase-like AAA ATPase [bacterium]
MSNVSKIYSAELEGVDAKLIEVETDINVGLHSFTIVGLADKALSEAKERVNSALKNVGVKPPTRENRKIVVNLAPADIKKTGSQYDLAIAIGYLLASGQIKEFDAKDKIFAGELSLEGKLRPINGALNIARLAARLKYRYLILPEQNASEAAIVPGLKVIPASNLGQIIDHLEGRNKISPQTPTEISTDNPQFSTANFVRLSEIKGQAHAKRALMIAAAGGHNLLMSGSPGTGKSMLAQAINSILPPMTLNEAIEVTQIYSAAGLLGDKPFLSSRPFRSPHQTASSAAIVGGGQNPKPGEISLAHRGILFLDELPEFRRDILEALRQPLENGRVLVSRAKGNVVFPAKFMLVAAMNPCPCGYYNDPEKDCRCGAHEVLRYQKKISGPLLDRIDIQIEVPRVKIEHLRKTTIDYQEEKNILNKIVLARQKQTTRLAGKKIFINAEMSSKDCDQLIQFNKEAERFLDEVFDKKFVSARGYFRILKVAQTIADLENSEKVTQDHLAEAFGYRLKEEIGLDV